MFMLVFESGDFIECERLDDLFNAYEIAGTKRGKRRLLAGSWADGWKKLDAYKCMIPNDYSSLSDMSEF